MFRRIGVFRCDPAGIDQEELELDLNNYGLEEMGERTGEKGEQQMVVRCDFENCGQLQKRIEERKNVPLSAEHEYICTTPCELPEPQATGALELIDKLEQGQDVQKVYHTLAGANSRRFRHPVIVPFSPGGGLQKPAWSSSRLPNKSGTRSLSAAQDATRPRRPM